MALQHGGCHQCILSHCQGFLTWILLHIMKMVVCCLHPGMKLSLGRHSRGLGASGVSPWFLLQLGKGTHSPNPVSPDRFSPQSSHCRDSSQAACKAGTPHYKLPLSGTTMSLDQMMSMAEGSSSGSCLGEGPHQPQQMPLSRSFLPWSVAWQNILWRMTWQWGPPCPHLWCLSKKALASNCHSASHTDTPSLSTSLLALAVFTILFSWFKLSKSMVTKNNKNKHH